MQLEPLITRLSILDKNLKVGKLVPNWAQQEYIRAAEEQLATTGRIRIIVLKARQLGISTISEALCFSLAFVFDHYKGLVIAHEIPASQNLLNMTKLYWNTYPFKSLFTPRYASTKHLEWVETGSSIQIATAGNKAVGRSATIHFLHASEVAFWPEADTVMLSLRQTIPNTPGTGIILESTANGMGNFFHREWVAAVDGDTEYIPLFFPWWKHPEYMASVIGIPYHSLGTLDSDEQALRSIGVSDDRLAWRRWAIRNLANGDLLKFMQEYPASPEEAFIASGTNVFPHSALRAVYQPKEGTPGFLTRNGQQATFNYEPTGPLRIFSAPSPDPEWGKYIVAGDPTKTTRGDYAVAQVLNRRTLEQVAVWRGRVDPSTFAEELFKLGIYYNNALITTESTGPGYATIGALLAMNYPHVWRQSKVDRTPGIISDVHGWQTTMQSKHLAIGWLLKAITDKDITIHDTSTFRELENYVTLENGGYGPADSKNGNDDTVMSLAIAITCHAMDSPLMAYGTESEPIDDSLPVALPWESWDHSP